MAGVTPGSKLSTMPIEQKKQMIENILIALKNAAILENKHFDHGDKFFELAFCSDESLKKIHKALNL